MKMKEAEVKELDEQAQHLKRLDPNQEAQIEARKALVAERWGWGSRSDQMNE